MVTTAVPAHRGSIRLAALRDGASRAVAPLSRFIHSVRREHVLWVVLAAVFLLYLITLVFEPSATGRGGR